MLLERERHLSDLEALLAEVRSTSAGRLVLLGGEAGVGKTALVRAFCDAQGPAVRVLWGACAPLRAPRPLGPLVDVAEELGGELEELVAGAARPFEVATALLSELRGREPTVLVLEDVHWADEATLDVLSVLAARVDSTSALVIASYRDDELERAEQLRYILGELVRGSGRMKVEPLSPVAVAELAQPHGLDGAALHRSTGGNPFFVTEVLAGGGTLIPDTVRDAVLARAAHLSPPARSLLDAAAIVPGQVELWLLEALSGDLGELEECLASGVLAAGRAHVEFRHELARLAIEEAMAPNRRLALHRAAIAALEARGTGDADAARLAEHADAAGVTEGVLRWAPRAAERAAQSGAHREAAAQYARALRFAGALPLEKRAALLERRVEECRLCAQFEEAIDAERQALACHRELGDRRGEADSLRSLSRLLFFAGRTEEGEPVALEAVELLETLPPGHELAMAYGNLAQRRMVVDNFAETVSWGNRALELAEQLGDDEAHLYALTSIGAAELDAGHPDGAKKLERAQARATQLGLEDYAARAGTLVVIGSVRRREFAVADAYFEPVLEYCTERGLDTWHTYLIALRARMELGRGAWSEAAASAALVLGDPRSPHVARAWALPTLALVRARRGDTGAAAPLEEARPLVESTSELMQMVPVAVARAEVAWLAGDHAAVEAATDEAFALARERARPWDMGELAYWRRQAGLHDDVPPEAVAEPYRLALSGEWEAAAERWREIGCPYEAAIALGEGGDQRAVDQLQRLGARPAATIIARRLRERGVRGVPRGPRQRTRENPAGLTARELEVLALLAEGLRNAQIAERLVVAHKTVDHHVSAILRKLDVRTRGEAGAKAVRLGLVTQEPADD